jgi:hypothetical protein
MTLCRAPGPPALGQGGSRAPHAYVQPHSGIDANLVAYWAVLAQRVEAPALAKAQVRHVNDLAEADWATLRRELGDQRMLGMSLDAGGHLTHGFRPNISGKMFDQRSYGTDPETGLLDYDAVRAAAREFRPLILIATEDLEVQATVVSKMLEQVGLTMELQILDSAAFVRKTFLSSLEGPPEEQTWDIALVSMGDVNNFPIYMLYHEHTLDGPWDWVSEEPELRRLYELVLGTVDRERQQALIRQMERHTRDQAYFLFLYNPIQLFAVNKAVTFVPYVTTRLILTETSVTDQHWSVQQGARKD